MSPATVTEAPIDLEPVTSDPFIADLADHSPDADVRLAALLRRVAATHPRIYD